MNKLFLKPVGLLEGLILFLFLAICVNTFAELDVAGPISTNTSINTGQICDEGGNNCMAFPDGLVMDEEDPYFRGWDKSTNITISESQISDLVHFTVGDEEDQVFVGWDKSSDINITESQIHDLQNYLTTENDPVYSGDPVSNITQVDIDSWDAAYDEVGDIPTALPVDEDITNLATGNDIYDFVTGLGYLTGLSGHSVTELNDVNIGDTSKWHEGFDYRVRSEICGPGISFADELLQVDLGPIYFDNFLGTVGIGTEDPQAALDVVGPIRTRPSSAPTCDGTTEGSIYYDDTENVFKGCDGSAWRAFTY